MGCGSCRGAGVVGCGGCVGGVWGGCALREGTLLWAHAQFGETAAELAGNHGHTATRKLIAEGGRELMDWFHRQIEHSFSVLFKHLRFCEALRVHVMDGACVRCFA